jgi:hypothetical protein
MGTWGHRPWDNDSAADWFGDTFADTKLAQRVEETLKLDIKGHAEQIRAAASLLVLLGHTYVWPIKDVDRHLELAATRLEEIRQSGIHAESPAIEAAIDAEIEELRSRLTVRPEGAPRRERKTKWWEL